MKPVPEHGTAARYKSGCRCDECRAAIAAQARAYMHRMTTTPRPDLICAEAGCERQRRAQGLCHAHYRSAKRTAGTFEYSPSDRWSNPDRVARSKARLAVRRGATPSQTFTVADLLDRDDYTCGICYRPIDGALAWPNPGSASIDHTIPVSLGGEHSASNARPAHLRCNQSRGNRTS